MNNFDWKAFKENKICVACPTLELAKDFLNEAHKRGLKWQSGDSLLSKDCWNYYKKETVYFNGITYGDDSCADTRKVVQWEINRGFTFEEVIARIKEGEVYEAISKHWSTKGIEKLDGEIIIKNDLRSEDLLVGATRYKLKEETVNYRIVTVEHRENGKGYEFISNFSVRPKDMVVCDTRYGKSFGMVIKTEVRELTKKQAGEYKKLIKKIK